MPTGCEAALDTPIRMVTKEVFFESSPGLTWIERLSLGFVSSGHVEGDSRGVPTGDKVCYNELRPPALSVLQ